MIITFIQCCRGVLGVSAGACIFWVIGVRERVEGHEIYTLTVEGHLEKAGAVLYKCLCVSDLSYLGQGVYRIF